ncbi:MAG: hypothetical protein IPL90_06960 [Holophagales bacterium]|nr:hypothetical protein [Holophagales bacterium]
MRTLLPGLGTAALGVAVLLTLALALTTKLFTLRPPGGADAMGLVVVFFLPIGAWLLVLFGALVCVARGGFDWVSRSPGIPTLVVLGTVVGLGILSVGAAVFSLEVRYASRTAAGLAGGLLLPLLVVGLVGFLLWSEPASVSGGRWLRPAGALLGALAVLAFAGGFVLFLKDAAEDARRAEEGRLADEARQSEMRAEDAKRVEAQAAELAALPDDTPIEVFLTHLFIDKSDEHHKRAVERIRALPNLTERMAARLEHPEPLEREHVLNFVQMAGTPDPAWEPLVRKAIVLLAADYRAEAGDLSLGRITHVKGLAWGALLAAEKFGPKHFEAEVRDLREAVSRWPNEEPRNDALEVIDHYLAGEPVPE